MKEQPSSLYAKTVLHSSLRMGSIVTVPFGLLSKAVSQTFNQLNELAISATIDGMDGPLPHSVGVNICSFKDLMHISGLVRTSSVKFCKEGCSKK